MYAYQLKNRLKKETGKEIDILENKEVLCIVYRQAIMIYTDRAKQYIWNEDMVTQLKTEIELFDRDWRDLEIIANIREIFHHPIRVLKRIWNHQSHS